LSCQPPDTTGTFGSSWTYATAISGLASAARLTLSNITIMRIANLLNVAGRAAFYT
jgi:hypothetical protein